MPGRLSLRTLAFGAALAAAVAAAYWGTLDGQFIWDDDLHVTANPTIVGPLGLKEIWTSARANYFPLVLTNFWVVHHLAGLAPLPYHAVTLACHALAAVLLWRVLLRLRVPGAWLGAALWALHPVQVESVAWISELKNTQSAVFFLAAIGFWLRWLGQGQISELPSRAASQTRPAVGRRPRDYFLALLCAALAILSKPSTVMLPVALGLCAWWQAGRVDRGTALRLAPFFALSAVAAGWTIWEQKFHSGAIGPEWAQTWPERCVIAGRAVWFYLGKLLWPDPLIFIYPRWTIDARDMLAWIPAVALVAVLAWLWRSRAAFARPALFAALYFGALLFPILGFFSVYFFRYSFVGDHFQYLASIGPLALLGAALARLAPVARNVAAAAALLALGALTWRHGETFTDMETLWRTTVTRHPECRMAWLNLGDTYSRQQRHEEAMAAYRRGIAIAPNDAEGHNDLGIELVLVDRAAEGLVHLQRSVELKPNRAESRSNLGHALRKLGRRDDAIAEFRRALELDPQHAGAHLNLGSELAELGRFDEALTHFRAALAAKPGDPATHDNLGGALRGLGRFDEAIAQHQRALRLRPDFAEAHNNLGLTLLAAGRPAEALPHFERALALEPAAPLVRGNLARALAALGRESEALAQLERAVQAAPKSAEAHHNHGVALAQLRRLPEAIAAFERALQLAPDFASAALNLGVAYSATGRWDAAAAQFHRVTELQPESADAHARLAVALVNRNQLEAAVPPFERALRLAPDNAETHANFAQVLRALGRGREALEHFEQAERLRRAARASTRP